MHGLFLTWTQNLVIHRSYITVFTQQMRFMPTQPLAPCYSLFLLTWRTSFLAHGANTHPLLSLVCYQLPTLCCFSHPNTPRGLSYNIYIDDINKISRPRLTHWGYTVLLTFIGRLMSLVKWTAQGIEIYFIIIRYGSCPLFVRSRELAYRDDTSPYFTSPYVSSPYDMSPYVISWRFYIPVHFVLEVWSPYSG